MPKGYPRIKRISDRKRKIYREYSPLRLAFLKCHSSVIDDPSSPETDKCQCCIMLGNHPVKRAIHVHHRKGRGKYELVQSTWAALCEWCHRFIHDHPAWAIEKNLLLPRATPLSDSGPDHTADKTPPEPAGRPPFGN